jgi:hypothetical protein
MRTREDLEKWALEDYKKVVGKTFFVQEFSAYVNSEFMPYESVDFSLEEPVKAKVVGTSEADVLHWNDEWLDPYWDLEILEIPAAMLAEHPKLAKMASVYMFGDSYSLDGKIQPARIDPRPGGPRDWSPRGGFDRKRR